MRYTITFKESDYNNLTDHLFTEATSERAAYALCKLSVTEEETRLLVREIIPVLNEDIEEATWAGMKIKNISFLRAMKRASETKHVFMFIHSHPKGYPKHSPKDDEEEPPLFTTAYSRIKTEGVHASMVISEADKPVARVWLSDGTNKQVSFIRVLGNQFRFFADSSEKDLPQFFDRQVRAFGEEVQKILGCLNVGIVGLGGTGSVVREQLTRLGVGKLTIFDGQKFENTNVNRVYGSRLKDEGVKKVDIAERSINEVGLGTITEKIDKPITYRSAAAALRNCDIIFGCTDDNWGRSILNRIALYYHIAIFDMGVAIKSEDQIIESIQGRVTTILHGNGCLGCRGRISSKGVQSESMAELDPERLKELIKQGYADELPGTAPSVISFTTAIASLAVTEFLHRITGFMGNDRRSSEAIYFFDEGRIRTNSTGCSNECIYLDDYNILRGDAKPFLDITWRPE